MISFLWLLALCGFFVSYFECQSLMFCLGKHFWHSELLKKFSMAPLRAIHHLKIRIFNWFPSLTSAMIEFGLKAVKCILAFWHLKDYELQTFISAWSFQLIHFSTSPKIEEKMHYHRLPTGSHIYILLGIWFENSGLKKCFITTKITKPIVIAPTPTKDIK